MTELTASIKLAKIVSTYIYMRIDRTRPFNHTREGKSLHAQAG
jgi:hypothetical protein